MNYLAHIYLSGPDPLWMVGGLLGDYVKGPIAEPTADPVKMGILLHRRIDRFVDEQPEFRLATACIEPPFRRFSGILVDMMYDHFLAQNWPQFHAEPLEDFCRDFYRHLDENRDQLPENALPFADNAARAGWLQGYADLTAMAHYLEGLGRRFKRPVALHRAMPLLEREYEQMEQGFYLLFPRIIEFADTQLHQIKSGLNYSGLRNL